jgi:hypothetical protein
VEIQGIETPSENINESVASDETLFATSNGAGESIADEAEKSSGNGRAQPLSAKVLTPDGYRLMGDLRAGDEVIAANGETAEIAAVYPQGRKEIYTVEFSDGGRTRATADHLWQVSAPRHGTCVMTLSEMKKAMENIRDFLPFVPVIGKEGAFVFQSEDRYALEKLAQTARAIGMEARIGA